MRAANDAVVLPELLGPRLMCRERPGSTHKRVNRGITTITVTPATLLLLFLRSPLLNLFRPFYWKKYPLR